LNPSTIIQQSINGDRAAQKQLYLQYCDLAMSLAIRYASDVPQAMDIVQNTFVRVFQNLHKFDGEISQFSTWISTICIREAIVYLKKSQRWVLDEKAWDIIEKMEDIPLEKSEDIELIQKTIEKMPLIHKSILMMYFYDELSHKEIAEILDIKESSSRSRLNRAKEELKIQLKWAKT